MTPIIFTDSSLKLELNAHYGILSGLNQGLRLGWYVVLSLVVRIILYVSILVVLVIIVTLIFKYLGQYGNDDEIVERTTTTETSHLMPTKAISFTYGTCDQEDLESGRKCSGNSSDELYDGKICIICYDEQRNCFFVPCGHCATCHVCAQRIVDEESKACPVCRRFIHRVKKLFTPQNEDVADFSRQEKIVSLE